MAAPHPTQSRHRARSNNVRAFRERSNACRSIGKLDRALADAREAVRLDPHGAKAFDDRGDVFVARGKYQCAIQDYDESFRLDPKLGLAFNNHGERRRLIS
jgi:tetratricopeptide (TPR) repeat protein